MHLSLGFAAALGILAVAVGGCDGSPAGAEGGDPDSDVSGSGSGGLVRGAGADSGPALGSARLEIFSWWTSGGEREALAAALNVFAAKYPEVQVANAAETYAERARDEQASRLALGNPPSTYQANIGADLLGRREVLQPLGKLPVESGWEAAFPPVLLETVSSEGQRFGVPLNVHRVNSLFYNKVLFDKFGLAPPTSLESFKALLKRIKESPEIQQSNPAGGVAPLALGNLWNWTASQFVFEGLLPAMTSPEFYTEFWQGRGDPSGPEIRDVLATALWFYCGDPEQPKCSGYFNDDVDTVDWAPAVERLRQGTAAMAVMGDWAKGLLHKADFKPGVEFGVVPFPGANSTFVFTGDAFPFPAGAREQEATRQLLITLASKEVQVVFSLTKGSIPARGDVADDPRLDDMHRTVIADFNSGKRVLAMSGLMPPGVLSDLSAELKSSLQRRDMEGVRKYLIGNYPSLTRKP